MMLLRVLISWLAITLTCWLVVGALAAPDVPGGVGTVAMVALLVSAPILLMVRGFTHPTYPTRATRLFVLRPFWYAQLLLPFATIAALLGIVIGAVIGVIRPDALASATAGGRVALALYFTVAAAFLIAGYVGSRRLVVNHYVAALPGLPAGFEGMRIVQLTDLHVGPHTPRRKLERIAAATRAAQPDLIALTGDLVDDYARDVEAFDAGLGRLTAPLGVVAIPGNHDVYAGWADVRAGLEARGITVLVNDAIALERDGSRIALMGTGDPAGLHFHRRGGAAAAPDLARAIAAATHAAAGMPVIALAHNPALWPALARHGVALTLSGHTHWGQFAIPRMRWSLASPFLEHAMGPYVARDSVLFVHPGTNYWGLPFRLGTPPEVAVIELRRGPAGFTSAG